ncbi:MAG: ATP-binding protein [Chitinophagales bacterium]|nr:ATP-binding protein [Chitinophagales bacterium]
MIHRFIYDDFSKLMKQFPAVAVVGPRQVGKTTLARQYSRTLKRDAQYLDLENPADVKKLSDPQLFLDEYSDRCVILDEVQRMPQLFPLLRFLIDKKRKPGRFLLLGSASPEMIKDVSESLAGRIAFTEVTPFNLTELPAKDNTQKRLWLRGGFPHAFLAGSDQKCFDWMRHFIQTYVERDLNQLFGVSFSPQVMYRLWQMIAHYHGNILNAQTFARGLDITAPTVVRYLDYLEGAFIIHRLAPFSFNTKKRLVKAPKLYLRDSGLLHALLDIHSMHALRSHPAIGNSWEGFVVEQIHRLKPAALRSYYYRTHDGSECDLILVKGLKAVACVEVKYSASPSLSKGFYESIKDLKSKNNFVLIPDSADYQLSKEIRVVGLEIFLKKYLPLIC